MLRLQLERLGLEVLDAEARGTGYAAATRQPHFPMMAAVYFGAADLLRWRLPQSVRQALAPILQFVAEGRAEGARRLWFALSRDRRSSEGALGRFIFWCAIVLNLRIHSWECPEAEAFGALSVMEEEAEDRLKELLDMPDMHDSEVRPLNVLMAALLEQMRLATAGLWTSLLADAGGGGLKEVLEIAEALRQTRRLDVRDAVPLESRLLDPTIASQQIVDRHSHMYGSVQALESQKSRALKKLSAGAYEYADDRFIDLLRTEGALGR